MSSLRLADIATDVVLTYAIFISWGYMSEIADDDDDDDDA
jgi:hypothetical protein